MFEFLKRLFRRKPKDEPGAVLEELWSSDMSGPASGRFLPVAEERFRAAYLPSGGFELNLLKENLFAWADAPDRRYGDFALEAEIEFAQGAGHCAAGFLLRSEGDGDFLYVLVSNRGYLRADAVFNGKPHAVIPWTECPVPPEPSFNLKAVMIGNRLTVALDDRWAAECEDDTVRQGHLAFAVQNYGEAPGARCVLRYILVESRPLEVEAWRMRWSALEKHTADQRVRLSKSLASAAGLEVPALVQLRKAEKFRPLDGEELFLRAECALRLGLYEDAEAALRASLALLENSPDGKSALAREELANLLYLRGRYLDLRDELEARGEQVYASPRLSGLLGHALWNLGAWEKAAQAYGSAAALEPAMPIFALNEARSWDQAGKRKEAADAYERAAREFFAQESFDDLGECLRRLKSLRPRSDKTAALEGKLLFRAGKKKEARRIFERLAEKDTDDSAVFYLLGLQLSEEGKRKEAVARFRRACELESGFPLYWFRLAEALFLSGDEEGAEKPLERVRELDPGNGWALNLEGLLSDRKGDLAEAVRLFRAARDGLPDQVDPAVNLADALSRSGRTSEALEILSGFPEAPGARNQAGNILVREGRLEDAAGEYDRAVRVSAGTASPSEESEYRTNYAACCLELERYSEAESQLRRALELSPDRRTYLLTGDLAARYGDRYRAETAWRAGLEIFPGDPELLERLARHQILRGAYKEAEESADELAKADPERSSRVRKSIEEATTILYTCASCGRQWRAPRQVPAPVGRAIRAQPPDDSPAGACPSCGKVYCVGCRKESLKNSRFTCPACGEFLKLTDERLLYLVLERLPGRRKP